MQRNSNGVEPGPMQQRDVLPRDVVLAVLLPKCCRPFRPKQLQHQRADLTGGLRSPLEQPHVTFGHQPIAQICCADKKRLTAASAICLWAVLANCAPNWEVNARK